MSDGTLYCPICRCDAFPKTSFGTVVSLDCGHVVRRDGQSFNKTKRADAKLAPEQRSYNMGEPRGSNSLGVNQHTKKRVQETFTAKTIPEPPQKKVESAPRPPTRTVSGTGNIADEILNMIGRKKA